MALQFEWDLEKAEANVEKHGVSFEEATTVFGDPLGRLVHDREHSQAEARFVLFGCSDRGRLLAVMHAERGGRIRLISARTMTPRERRGYERFQE